MKKKTPAAEPVESSAPVEVIMTYKGFDKNMQCRGYQFEIGKTYLHHGEVVCCPSKEQASKGAGGFHACEYPLDVLSYYEPASSQFAIVEQSGTLDRHDEDSKVSSSSITVKASIGIPGLITAAFEFITKCCDPVKTKHSTGDRSASSATGDSSASSATGDSSASSATGYSSASSATGYRSASSATGDRSASLTTGWYSSSEIKPSDGLGTILNAVAIAVGGGSKARAPIGCAIVCVNRDSYGNILHIRASKVGENGTKPNTFYTLNADGEFVEA